MFGTFWALVPPIIAIGLALITKEVYSSLFIGAVAGALFYAGFHVEALDSLLNDGVVAAIRDNAGIFMFLVLLGILVALLNKAGGSAAFGAWAKTHIKTRGGAMFATFLLGVLIFVDDYFNCLTVGSVMRPVTDSHHVSRAKLAYIIDATAAPICMIAPISSWAAAVSGVVEDYSGFDLFIRAIPFNFYSLLTIVMVLFLCKTGMDYGPMRRHELNAIRNNDLFTEGEQPEAVEEVTNPRARVIDLLLPIIVLVVMIIMGYSLPRSAIYCTIFSIIIAAISPETRMSPRKLLQTLMDGVRQAANIAIPTAACGIMIGIVVNSGVAVKIAKLIGTSGEGSLFIALLIAALGCLLLGMALPTVAAYLIAVTLFASAIQGLGISALVTNMFIFYFGVVAQITPPVCLASFTAAGIAGASAWKTGWKAFSFAITAFIVPFAFVYRPAILLEGTMVEIIIAYCIVIAATYLLACGIAGYLFRPLKMWERIACYVVAFIFILPSSMSDIIGIAGCALIMAYCFMTGKKNANKAQPA